MEGDIFYLNVCSFCEKRIKSGVVTELHLIQMSKIETFSFKHTIGAYLEFRNCITHSSNCQKFPSHSPGHVYCSLLSLDAVNFVNITTLKRAGLLCI